MEINMLTFVVWVVGILLILWLFKWTLILVLAAFQKHWFMGLCCVVVALMGWVGMVVGFVLG